jgi:ribonuclease VapC
MIVDTSALIAIFAREPEAERGLTLLAEADEIGINSATVLETGIVLSYRKGRPMQHAIDLLLLRMGIDVIPFDDEHQREALQAWWSFGKGRHPARLNFGDCISYATARISGRPLLCKGDGFTKTDLPLERLVERKRTSASFG